MCNHQLSKIKGNEYWACKLCWHYFRHDGDAFIETDLISTYELDDAIKLDKKRKEIFRRLVKV